VQSAANFLKGIVLDEISGAGKREHGVVVSSSYFFVYASLDEIPRMVIALPDLIKCLLEGNYFSFTVH